MKQPYYIDDLIIEFGEQAEKYEEFEKENPIEGIESFNLPLALQTMCKAIRQLYK